MRTPHRLYLLLIMVIAAAIAVACNQPQGAAIAQALFTGRAIVSSGAWHGLPSVLGPQTFSAPASPWLDEGWLGALGISLLGSRGIFFASVLLAAAAFVLVERRCRQRGLGPGETALALGIAFTCSLGVLRVGGGLLDLVFAAAFFLFLERAPRNSAWWAIPVTVLWCNASIHGFIAPLWGALFAAGNSFGPARADRIRRAGFYLSLVLAMLATPAGIHIFTAYIADLRLDPTAELRTWQPAYVSPLAFYGGFIPTLIVAAYCGLRRAGVSDTATAIGAVLFSLINGQYLGVAGIVLGPIVATAWANLREEKRGEIPAASPRERIVLGVTASAAAFAVMFSAEMRSVSPTYGEAEKSVKQIGRDERAYRLFCAEASWCDYALEYPHVRVFTDGRPGYPLPIRNDMRVLARAEPGWRKILDGREINAVVTPGTRLASLLQLLPAWRCEASGKIWTCERNR